MILPCRRQTDFMLLPILRSASDGNLDCSSYYFAVNSLYVVAAALKLPAVHLHQHLPLPRLLPAVSLHRFDES